MKYLPSESEIKRIQREAKLTRAIEAYKFFYPTLSMLLNFDTLDQMGAKANRGLVAQLTTPHIVSLTQNSDTPYGLAWGDMTEVGPMVLEVPAGKIMGVIDDLNFRYVSDFGLTGEDAGKGASYLFVPPGYSDDLPSEGYIVRHLDSNFFLVAGRAPDPNAQEGIEFLKQLKFYPLSEKDSPTPNTFRDASSDTFTANPCVVDGTFDVWTNIKRALEMDVPCPAFYNQYGLLADLGLKKGEPFEPDAEMKDILTEAATKANEQMAAAAFASDDPARMVWDDRKWEWVVYGEGNNGYYHPGYLDLFVRDRWFYQATLETPKMFMREPGAGSIYWLGIKDDKGAYLDGGKNYTLTVPSPVPVSLFWSVTLYDLDTRSEIDTKQFKPVLTSLRDNLTPDADGNITLYFGPDQPQDKTLPWLETNAGSQWFTYFRMYGPGKEAFDGSWKPSDFTEV